jgi:hypothetical protein
MIHRYLIIILISILTGCNLDQVDKHYSDNNAIISDDYDKKGWLPQQLILTSATDLYSRTNVDINSFLIRYSINRNDLDTIMIQLDSSGQKFQKPHGLIIPEWWSDNINELKTYKFRPNTNTWTFAIDNKNLTIYCWGKH